MDPDKQMSSCSSPFLFKPGYLQVPNHKNFEDIRGYISRNKNWNIECVQKYGIFPYERQTDPIWTPYYG